MGLRPLAVRSVPKPEHLRRPTHEQDAATVAAIDFDARQGPLPFSVEEQSAILRERVRADVRRGLDGLGSPEHLMTLRVDQCLPDDDPRVKRYWEVQRPAYDAEVAKIDRAEQSQGRSR